MKVYFGVNEEAFECETIEQLQKEAKKYNINIGDRVRIEYNVRIGERVSIGYNVRIGERVSIGYGVRIGYDVSIRYGVSIGYKVSIGDGVRIGYNVRIGNRVSILERAKIPEGVKIDKIYHLQNEYKYSVSGYGNYIQLGRFTRTTDEWDNNFWNNNSEFPKGSKAGELRLKAYNKMKILLKG